MNLWHILLGCALLVAAGLLFYAGWTSPDDLTYRDMAYGVSVVCIVFGTLCLYYQYKKSRTQVRT